MPNTQLSLTEVCQDAVKAANTSWTESDKLYVSVCSALVALAAIFGWGRSGSEITMMVIGLLLLLLAANWWRLINRYREKILDALDALSKSQDVRQEAREHFAKEHSRFEKDSWGDHFIAGVVGLMSLLMIAAGGWSMFLAQRESILVAR